MASKTRTPEQRRQQYKDRCRRRHYVYGLCDPHTFVVKYVGCTGELSKRIRTHKMGRDERTAEWVRELTASPYVVIFDEGDSYTACRAEGFWIAKYKDTLLNRHLIGFSEEFYHPIVWNEDDLYLRTPG